MIAAAMLAGFLASSCSPEAEVNHAAAACAAKLHNPYNPQNMSQCVNVCLNCNRGTMTTCTTSCTLKGAK